MGCGVSKHSDMYGLETPSYCNQDKYTNLNRQLKTCKTDYERSMMLMHMSLYGG